VVSQESSNTGFSIRQEKAGEDTSPTSENSGGLVIAIKNSHVNNAAEFTAAPAFNIANPSMGKRKFAVCKSYGIGSSGVQNNYEYLCFTQTRSCNAVFYQWLAKEALVSFLRQSKFL
jgi:hypothetical protein